MDSRRHQEGNKKKFLEVKENKDTSYQNLRDTLKAVLRGRFISWGSFNKRSRNQQILNNKRINTTAQSPRKTRAEKHQK